MLVGIFKFAASVRIVTRTQPRLWLHALLAAVFLVALRAAPAFAVPSFAVQTGQPCAACHVGAFGPQLKPYGRDFKLHGYVAADGNDKSLPLAGIASGGFTRTQAPQPGGAAPGFKPNNNFAFEELAVFYAGRITPKVGAFIEVGFDAITRQAQLGKVDVRHAREGRLFGEDVLWGITANNDPTVQDVWNGTPSWSFPHSSSGLAPKPVASTLIDGGLGQRVGGLSGYMLWNELLYLEAGVYKGLSANLLNATGIVPVTGADRTRGVIPYGRLSIIKDSKPHYFQVGAYALTASVIPGGNQTFGQVNRLTDLGLDATYQFILNPKSVASDMLSAHATYIRETGKMGASQALSGALPRHSLETFRVDASYSFAATITPSVQYFQTKGTRDANYWDTHRGSPNSSGMIYEIAYVPFGKPDSPYPGFNAKLALQYVDYFRFDGSRKNAKNNNTTYLSLMTGLKF